MANKGWNTGGGAANDSRDPDGSASFVQGSKAAAIGGKNDPLDKRSDVFESESVLGVSTNR